MSVIDDLWKELLIHTKYSNVVLTGLWQQLQKKESDKTPDEWQPTYVNVYSPETQQVLQKNPNRASLSITNNGPGDVALSNRYFNHEEAVALYNNTGAGTAQMLILTNGKNVTIGTRGAVYAYSISYANGDAAQLSIVETIYAVSVADHPQQHIHTGGIAKMMEQGVPLDGDEIPWNRSLT